MYENYCIIRDLNHVTDYQVAKDTGINRSTFSDWKSGRSEPKQDKLRKIAKYFGCSVEYLMGMDVPMFPLEKRDGESGRMAERESAYIFQIESVCTDLNEDSLRRLATYASRLHDLQKAEEEIK